MKGNFLQLIKISISLLLIISISNPVSGLNGTDVWSEGSFMIFETDIRLIYNHDIEPTLPANIDISNEELIIKYEGLNDDENMEFTESFLDEVDAHAIIDPRTGLTDENDLTFRFSSTKGWEDGFETEYRERFEYTDDLGFHSNTEKYKVIGDKFDYSLRVDGGSKTISSWKLEIDSDINYNIGLFSFQEKTLLKFSMTNGNGVLVQSSIRQEINVKAIEDTTFETLIFFEFIMDAIRSEGVKLNSDSGSDSGFVSLLIPWTTIMTLTIMISFYRRRKV